MLDFGLLPPEVNSGLMYVGAGSSPLVGAAAAWAHLADELGTAADGCAAALAGITGGGWQGPAAVSMAVAATPYAAWMRATADHVAHAARQASAAAGAYEAAFSATVPPIVISENRAELTSLVATNVLGQNTAAIAATDAAYAEMWALDAAAMYRYAGDSAAASALIPLSAPPVTTTEAGPAGQAAAVAHANSTAAASTHAGLSQLLSELPNALQALTAPGLDGWNIFSPANGSVDYGLSGLLNMLSGHTNSALGDLLNAFFGNSVFSSGWWNPTGVFNVFNSFDYLLIYAAQDQALHAIGGSGIGSLGPMISQIGSVAPVPADLGGPAALGAVGSAHTGSAQITADVGKATLLRSLSVPQKWAASVAPGAMTATSAAASMSTLPTVPLGIGAGSTILPGAPMPGAVRGKSRYARRYGFRPIVTAQPPAGG